MSFFYGFELVRIQSFVTKQKKKRDVEDVLWTTMYIRH